MENAISLITAMPDTRSGIADYVKQVKESILSGYTEPFETAKMLKAFEEIVKQLRDDQDIKMMIENESDKYHEKTIEVFGAKFTKQERPYFDYSECNDSDLTNMYSELDNLKVKIKDREEFLKHVPENFVNAETGEIVNRPTKTVKTIISVTLK